jgi:hypothetical protein
VPAQTSDGMKQEIVTLETMLHVQIPDLEVHFFENIATSSQLEEM